MEEREGINKWKREGREGRRGKGGREDNEWKCMFMMYGQKHVFPRRIIN